MATWWAEFFASMNARTQAARATLTGQQPVEGTLAAALQPTSAQLTANQPFTGQLAVVQQPARAALSGFMVPEGVLAGQLRPAQFSATAKAGIEGEVSVQLRAAAAALNGAQMQQGSIAATLQRASAQLVGNQPFTATMAAQLRPAVAALSGAQTQQGSFAAQLKAASASFTAVKSASTAQLIWSDYAGTSAATLTGYTIGDLIVMCIYGGNSISPPSPPAPTTTTPAWNMKDNTTGVNANAMAVAWYFADRLDHTSGVWGSGTNIAYMIVRNAAASPFGGYAQSGSTAAGSATAPAMTLSRTDGTSLALHALGHKSGLNFTTWLTPPAGYTQRANGVTSHGLSLLSKDSSVSDGSVTQATDGTTSNGYRGVSMEILAA